MPKMQEAEGASGMVVFRLVLWVTFADFVCFSFWCFMGITTTFFYKLALLASVTMKKKQSK